ncbi:MULTISPECIES: hypothetical protein [unclassified Streptomyces]|uniref:hypothetical protein n=1 Tax=unclassified Streptomyces TaxID=2593676 RepID=UPI002E8115F8|nr:hypothetical protein [Streptomyces sp. NBC_00589]WTI37412.1 hypothetical protein OIC96_21550 [Streptomyces sp. NBC_00775]WUB28911.1 hypothetical protein OHA51_28185 [Streptomyces sp. NBC_00589]
MSKTIRGVRLDPDGTLTDIQLPAATGLVEALRKQVDGWVEIAHYARPEGNRRLAVAVDADGALTKPENLYATSLVNALYLTQLPYPLYGPVVLLGALDDSRHHTDMPEPLHEVLPQVMDALKSRYTPSV